MKTKIFILIALGVSTMGLAQKDEIKDAEKALKNGDVATAKTAVEAALATIGSADDKLQAQYYAVRGNVYSDLAKKGDASAFQPAIDAYKKTIEVEKASGRSKYTSVAQEKLNQITADLVNAAVEDNNNQKFSEAAEKLYMSYKLSPVDTIYLYYAASSAVNGQNYEKALDYY